jgi:hypothetical protein
MQKISDIPDLPVVFVLYDPHNKVKYAGISNKQDLAGSINNVIFSGKARCVTRYKWIA